MAWALALLVGAALWVICWALSSMADDEYEQTKSTGGAPASSDEELRA